MARIAAAFLLEHGDEIVARARVGFDDQGFLHRGGKRLFGSDGKRQGLCFRGALVVATAIPLTVAFTFGGMLFGIPLHQISIAGLIIALGVLVDDPVVTADGINREIAHGQPRGIAAWLGPVKLARPIMFGTIINLAPLAPLVLPPGDTGAFIYALPVVVRLALIGSRLVSMTFTPLLGYFVLRGQKGLKEGACCAKS